MIVRSMRCRRARPSAGMIVRPTQGTAITQRPGQTADPPTMHGRPGKFGRCQTLRPREHRRARRVAIRMLTVGLGLRNIPARPTKTHRARIASRITASLKSRSYKSIEVLPGRTLRVRPFLFWKQRLPEHFVDGSPHVLYNSLGGIRTIAFQEAPVITSIEVPRGWCAFHKFPSYC